VSLVVSAVVTLAGPESTRARARACIAARPEIECGAEVDSRLPIVATTACRSDDEALWRAIAALDGVVAVAHVFAAWEVDP